MKFTVSSECYHLGLRAGAILFRGLTVGPSPNPLRKAIQAEGASVREQFADSSAIRNVPEIRAFQDILRLVGVNPRREQNSVERLLHFAHKRGDLPVVNALVDAYNLVSIRTHCSLGAHDVDRIASPVSLERLTTGRDFLPLGALVPATVREGEYAYVDGTGSVLCRLDIVQADFSKVTTDTHSALLIVESTASHELEKVHQAFDEVVRAVIAFCGGTAEVIATPDGGADFPVAR